MTDALKQLWESTAAFQQRFGLDKKFSLPAQMRCVHEEISELAADAYGYWYTEDGLDAENFVIDATQEAADVIVTVLGVLMGMGVEYSDVADAIEHIAAKNDAKTHETHAIDANGKVSRKVEA